MRASHVLLRLFLRASGSLLARLDHAPHGRRRSGACRCVWLERSTRSTAVAKHGRAGCCSLIGPRGRRSRTDRRGEPRGRTVETVRRSHGRAEQQQQQQQQGRTDERSWTRAKKRWTSQTRSPRRNVRRKVLFLPTKALFECARRTSFSRRTSVSRVGPLAPSVTHVLVHACAWDGTVATLQS